MKGKIARTIGLYAGAALIAFAASGPAHATGAGARPDAPARARVALDRDFIVGNWSDDGDCALAVAFVADGTFATPEGDQGVWALEGHTLTLSSAAGESHRITVVPIDRDTMEMLGEDGSLGRSTRCEGDLGSVHFDEARIA